MHQFKITPIYHLPVLQNIYYLTVLKTGSPGRISRIINSGPHKAKIKMVDGLDFYLKTLRKNLFLICQMVGRIQFLAIYKAEVSVSLICSLSSSSQQWHVEFLCFDSLTSPSAISRESSVLLRHPVVTVCPTE